MSVKAQNWVWEYSRAEGTDLLVALAIADRANDEGEEAWPNMDTLCRKTRLSRSTVSRSVQNLEQLGELRVDRERGKRNAYVLTMPIYEEGDDAVDRRPSNVARPNQCQFDTGESEPGTGVNLTPLSDAQTAGDASSSKTKGVSPVTPPPVSAVTPPPVSLLTHKTSCTSITSSTHTARARNERSQGTLIAKGEGRNWAARQDRIHQGCHPEICNWRGTTKGMCMPAGLVPLLASKLPGLDQQAAIADVIAWAQKDSPPPGAAANGDDFKHWRERWNLTRVAPPVTRAPDCAVPGVADTDALIAELTGGRLQP